MHSTACWDMWIFSMLVSVSFSLNLYFFTEGRERTSDVQTEWGP